MATRKIRTMQEFAAASGLSRPTISKYFDDPGSVRGSTRARIEEALRRFDYRPNIFAQTLGRRRSRIIGMIVPHATDPFYAELVRHIELRCTAEGYLVIVLSSHGETRLEARAIETLLALRISGAIVVPLGFASDRAAIATLKANIPLVFADSPIDDQTPFVGTDNHRSIGQLVDYWVRIGERPTFFGLPRVNHNGADRLAAYLAAMARVGQSPEVVGLDHDVDWNFERTGYEAALKRFDGSGFPTRAILCTHDRLAFGLMAAAYERGHSIGRGPGRDLLVTGHDDHPLSRYATPGITTVAQDFDRLGNLAVEVLLRQIGDLPASAASDGHHLLDARLVMRQSA